jgi:hypothetical protein
MNLSVFAFLDDVQKSVQQFIHNCLLVAGAFLVGYILGGILGWGLGKWAFKQKSPDTLKQLGRPIGGIVLALIVALLVFTGMGGRLGAGGEGQGTPNDTGSKDSAANRDSSAGPRVVPPKVDQTTPEAIIRVTVLAGAAVRSERKFYLLNDDPNAITLEELKAAIKTRQSQVKGKTVLQVLFSSDPNLAPPRNDPKVTDVTRWATEDAGLDVVFPASK